MAEKKISEVTLRLEESLKRDLQDLAMHQDRTLSEVIRVILEDHLYGLKRRLCDACAREPSRPTMQGNSNH